MADNERVLPVLLEDEMKKSYIDYSMSVIVSRALPDVRDGLKPVHRRILTAMNDLNLTHDRPYRKSAKITGDVTGNYHPHGTVAVYDTPPPVARGWGADLEAPPRFNAPHGEQSGVYAPPRGFPVWMLVTAFVLAAGLGLGLTILIGTLV